MPQSAPRRTVPVGIDLGTTYSCLSYLTPEGQPVTVPNSEGELATPSVVLFDRDEVVVGTEALRSSVVCPDRVVSHAKRFMGDPNKCWVIDGHAWRPKDIASLIIRKLIEGAQERIGPIRHAVITVPAQFSELQRQDTVEAGLAAGLKRVDIIHEPVAAALCYVLSEGMWFAELANDQTILVFDLGGGTFDLSLVSYSRQKQVRVIASGGDLRLGGLDWNRVLEEFACDEFIKDSISDPRLDRESMQALSIEVEQLKRSLSVRPKSTVAVQHDGRRKIYAIDREHFELLSRPLLDRTEKITQQMLKSHKLGWARVDTVLVTGGASRMPMVRGMLQRISGTTLNQSLSPDQSICHGAAYYAGMLISGRRQDASTLDDSATSRLASYRQQSVSGRALGVLVRDVTTGTRVPHYLIPANTPLPCAYRQRFGTVVANQKRVRLHIVESGTSPTDAVVELGECIIDELPQDLPVSSPIEVTIRYDEQARVHVEAIDVTSGASARITIMRPAAQSPETSPNEPNSAPEPTGADTFTLVSPAPQQPVSGASAPSKDSLDANSSAPQSAGKSPAVTTADAAQRATRMPSKQRASGPPSTGRKTSLERAERPVPLCNECGEVLDAKGRCPQCQQHSPAGKSKRTTSVKRQQPGVPLSEDEIPTEPMSTPPPAKRKPEVKIRKKS